MHEGTVVTNKVGHRITVFKVAFWSSISFQPMDTGSKITKGKEGSRP